MDLGSFYLDVIKDRQYTISANNLARRSAQTAMYHIIEAMVRWFAPIMSFTAEEIWSYIPGPRNESVLLNTWYQDLPSLPEDAVMNQKYWDEMRRIRDCVNKEIEDKRTQGQLGSALEAEVKLFCDGEMQKQLQALNDELRFVLITSSAQVQPLEKKNGSAVATEIPGMWLQVTPTRFMKCERCWHRLPDVDNDENYPGLCERCVINVKGEERIGSMLKIKTSGLHFLWITLVVFITDYLTKRMVINNIHLHHSVPVLPHFNYTLEYNNGAAFSFLNVSAVWPNLVFGGISIVVSMFIILWLSRLRRSDRLMSIGLAMILGGALGNLWDRFSYNHVIDFIDLYISNWHWPVFNVADAAISVGAFLLILKWVK